MIRRNAAVGIGAVATVVCTTALVASPAVIPFEPIRDGLYATFGVWLWDNPFVVLPFLGGIGGGFVAGYLSSNHWYHLVANAIQAILFGLICYYVLNLTYNLLTVPFLTVDVGTILVLQPLLFFLVPFALLYLLEGVPSAFAARYVRTVVADRTETGTESVDGTSGIARVTRLMVAVLAFALEFLAVWWFVFVIEDTY